MPFSQAWRDYHPNDLLYGLAGPRNHLAAHMGIKDGDIYTIDQFDIFADAKPIGSVKSHLVHDKDFIKVLQSSAKTAQIVGTDLNDGTLWNNDLVGTAAIAKRKCKAGLEFVIYHTTYHIHFCLGGMNLEQVAAKNYDGSAGGMADSAGGKSTGLDWKSKARSITGAELRWVYRHSREPMVQSKVQFWKDDGGWKQCPPPWKDIKQPMSVRSAFAAYKNL